MSKPYILVWRSIWDGTFDKSGPFLKRVDECRAHWTDDPAEAQTFYTPALALAESDRYWAENVTIPVHLDDAALWMTLKDL